MSSTSASATKSTSDKADVSFATDDEEETSSSAEESAEETTSSSGSESEEKSDDDGDADDESEMPTFTLSLQPSTGAENPDDALPDLSRPSVRPSQQEIISHVETVTTYSSSKTDATTRSDAANETHPKSPEKKEEKVVEVVEEEEEEDEEDAEDESEESGETETSEEETEEKAEDEVMNADQTMSMCLTAATPSSNLVSTTVDTEEHLSSSSVSKVSITESKICVQEVKTELASSESVENKAVMNAEKNAVKSERHVTEIHGKQISAAKTEEKSSLKNRDPVVVENVSKVEIETQEKAQDLARAAAAKTAEVETTHISQIISKSVEKQDIKSSKKKKKDSEPQESTSHSLKADVIEPNPVQEVSKPVNTKESKTSVHSENRESSKSTSKSHKEKVDEKESTEEFSAVVEEIYVSVDEKATKTAHKPKAKETKSESRKPHPVSVATDEHSVKEMRLSAMKSAESDAGTTRRSPADEVTVAKSSEINEVKAIVEQKESSETRKSSKSRKSKAEAKESKNEVTSSTVQEEQSTPINLTTKSSIGESNEIKTAKTTDKKLTHKTEIKKDDSSISKSDKTAAATAKVSETDKTPETSKGATENIIEKTSTSLVEVVASESSKSAIVVDKASGLEASDEMLTSKKKVKDQVVDGQKKTKSVVETESLAASTLTDKESANTLKTDMQIKEETFNAKTATTTDSSLAPVTESEKIVTENRADKKSLLAESVSDETKFNDAKLNGVEDDDTEKPPEEAEFRPRRNSIDEFIKRILAEARDEQKKILDSCAVSSETSAETGNSVTSDVAGSGGSASRGTASELKHQQPIVNGVDLSLPSNTAARKGREDFDIEDELADISRYYAKRTLIDRLATDNDEQSAEDTSTRPGKSQILANGDDPPANDEPQHFVPQRRDATALVVRESARPVKILVDQQTSVIRQLSETSRAVDELDNEIRQLRQSCGGREVLYNAIGSAIREELRLYELESEAAGGRLDQQRLPGGGRFVREQFVSQCAAELFQRPSTLNGPRLDRSAGLDDLTRVGRRRSGSLSAASVDEDIGWARSSARGWVHDREPTDLTAQYRHSRAGSVASDRGYSSLDPADEPRASTSSVLSRLTAINGSIAAVESDLAGRSSRASSEVPRTSYLRPQTSYTDEWVSSGGSAYSAGRQYSAYGHEDANGDLDIGYRFTATRPQPTYRIYHAPSFDTTSSQPSRLYARRGSLQGYSSHDSGTAGDADHTFNSRFLSRVREKKALGETTSRQSSSDRPFRSRFLKSSGGGTSTTYSSSSTSRSATHYDESDDN